MVSDKKKGKEQKKRTAEIALIAFIILLAPFNIYLLAAGSLMFDEDVYRSHFQRHNIYERCPDADKTTHELLDYFKSPGSMLPDIDGFNERERSHLLDVKNVVQMLSIVFLITFSLAITCFLLVLKIGKDVYRTISYVMVGCGLSIVAFSAVLLLGAFSDRFVQFHSLFFADGTWIFPSNDLLIRMFPEVFFFESAMAIAQASIFTAVTFVIFGLIFYFSGKKSIFTLVRGRKNRR